MTNFSEVLISYMDKIDCTAGQLAKDAGISGATLSRYHSGQRTPLADDVVIEKLATAISNHIPGSDAPKILSDLRESLDKKIDFDNLSNKINLLIDILEINVNDLAKSLNFDASYISRIRTGKRHPANPSDFVDSVCSYIDRHFSSSYYLDKIAELIGPDIYNNKNLGTKEKLQTWFSIKQNDNPSGIESFLHKLNDFNLDEYIKVIKFDKLKIPHIPLYHTVTKTYYGLKMMKQGELDFFKSSVLSKSKDDIFMYSNMPMDDMAKDLDFNKKWMFAIAMSLKKGLNLNIIHNLNRPFNELLLGLEAWIPIYMTGQIRPYHIPGKESGIVNSLLYVSGSAALSGCCIKGHHGQGKYTLYGGKEDIKYHKKQSEYLLHMAQPLMEIYSNETIEEYNRKYGNISLTPPKDSSFYDTFSNIKIGFLNDEAVFIQKDKSPEIRFVIRHPKLINALKEFVPPVVMDAID